MDDDRRFDPLGDEGRDPNPTEGVRILGAEPSGKAAPPPPAPEDPTTILQGLGERDLVDEQGAFGDLRGLAGPVDEADDVDLGGRAPLRFPVDADAPGSAGSPSGPVPALPHWTEPPTGEVPRVLLGDSDAGDELDTWAASQGPRWRGESDAWHDHEDDDLFAGSAETRIGALDPSRPGAADLYRFDDEDVEEPDEPPVAVPPRPRPAGPGAGERPQPPPGEPPGRNLPVAIATGVALAVVAVVLFALGPATAMILVVPLGVLASAEFFTALRRAEFHPATLLGLAACGLFPLAVYWRGVAAYPLVLFLVVVAGLLWYLFVDTEARPVPNLAVTLLVVGYVGGLGSFAALLLSLPNGVGLLVGPLVGAVAYDVGGFFIGRSAGQAKLAPSISPGKTVEGLVGGMVLALVACVLVASRIAPWNSLADAARLGLVVAVMAPLGDLAESLLKRDLGVKDMGGLLPGHGGVLDRIDGMLFAVPAAFFLATILF